jgi:hypothetical protein
MFSCYKSEPATVGVEALLLFAILASVMSKSSSISPSLMPPFVLFLSRHNPEDIDSQISINLLAQQLLSLALHMFLSSSHESSCCFFAEA